MILIAAGMRKKFGVMWKKFHQIEFDRYVIFQQWRVNFRG
jgi:hypothetical protein